MNDNRSSDADSSHLWYCAYTFARESLRWDPARSAEYATTYEHNVTVARTLMSTK